MQNIHPHRLILSIIDKGLLVLIGALALLGARNSVLVVGWDLVNYENHSYFSPMMIFLFSILGIGHILDSINEMSKKTRIVNAVVLLKSLLLIAFGMWAYLLSSSTYA
jgi:hypothetical protein